MTPPPPPHGTCLCSVDILLFNIISIDHVCCEDAILNTYGANPGPKLCKTVGPLGKYELITSYFLA